MPMKAMLALFAACAGCSTVTTSSKAAAGVSLEGYHTYAWATPAATGDAEQAVRAALQRELALRGMLPIRDGAPDFVVVYHGERRDEERVLVVDFVDPRTDIVFWRGTVSSLLELPGRPDLDKIDKAIAELLQKYPAPVTAEESRVVM